MPAGKAHSEVTRTQALQFYSSFGLNEATRRMEGIASRSAIQKWAKAAGLKPPLPSERRSPAMSRQKTYHKAARLKLNDRLFARIEATLKREKRLPTNQLKDLSLAYAILTDKRRLEEGRETGSALDLEQLEKEVRAMPSIRSGGNLRAIAGGKNQ